MPLKLLVFLGSVRDSTPPRPARLGLRVALRCVEQLRAAGHEVRLIDPLDYPTPAVFKPLFSYPPTRAPQPLQQLASEIETADGYVMVSPEYNHSMSPALANLLNHFGSSLFSWKPSVIVTYSASQWGGVRAAVNMRSFLSELGCLPVSAMIHLPAAHEVLAEDGGFAPAVDGPRWTGYFARAFDQLQWWATAAKAQRDSAQGDARPATFTREPAQRNAP